MTINNKSERNYRGKCLGWPVTSYGAGAYECQFDYHFAMSSPCFFTIFLSSNTIKRTPTPTAPSCSFASTPPPENDPLLPRCMHVAAAPPPPKLPFDPIWLTPPLPPLMKLFTSDGGFSVSLRTASPRALNIVLLYWIQISAESVVLSSTCSIFRLLAVISVKGTFELHEQLDS